MAEYLISVFVMSGCLALFSYISYSAKNERATKILSSVLLLYTIVAPIPKLVSLFDDGITKIDFEAEKESFDYTYIEVATESFSEGIIELVSSEYNLPKEKISVKITELDFEKMRAESIVVTLKGVSALADWRGIEARVEELGLGNCEVKISFG